MSHPEIYYRPEGSFGPICDALVVLDDDLGRGALRLQDDDGDGPEDPDEDVFGPYEDGKVTQPVRRIVCKKNPDTGELYNCRVEYTPEGGDKWFPEPPCYFEIDGECYNFPEAAAKEFGLQDDFFVPPLNPETCLPFRNDLNIAPITRVREDGSTYKLYPVERSNPVTFPVTSGAVEGASLDVKFSNDGNSIVVRGDSTDSGTAVCTLSWDDDPTNNGTALGKISIPVTEVDTNSAPTTWTQSTIYDAASLPGVSLTGVALLYFGNGIGEIGQFAPPDGNTSGTQYFAFGTPTTNPFSTQQTLRRVEFTADLTGSRTLFVHAISGNDRNGGERINNIGEGLRVIWPDNSEQVLLPSRQDWVADTGGSYSEYDDRYDNWSLLNVDIPEQYRTTGVSIKLQQNIVSGPEFQSEDIQVYFNSAGDLVVDGNGDAEVTLKFAWDDNPNQNGVALGTWSANGVTFTQTTGIPQGNDTQTMNVVAGNVYSATITGNSGGFTVDSDDEGNTRQVLCFKDNDGDDCNATLEIHKVKKGVNTIAENNPNGGDALGIAAVGWGGAASFEQAERGSESHKFNVSANQTYPITFTDLNPANTTIKVRDDNTRLIFYDGAGTDTNAEFFIDSVENTVGSTAAGYWSDVGNRYAVWVNPAVCTLPCLTQTITYQITFPATDKYFFEFGCDDNAKVFFGEEEVPILDVAGGIFRSGALSTPYVVEKTVTAGTHTVVVVITNSNPRGNERTVDAVFIPYSAVRREANNPDGYTDALGTFGLLDYTNPARYFSVISRAVAEEYITGRFGRTETITGQYVFRGRGPDKNGHLSHVNYYVSQGGSRSDTTLNATAWAATKQNIYDNYVSGGEINEGNVIRTYYPDCSTDSPVGKSGTDTNDWALDWGKNPGGYYMRICRGTPCSDGESLDWVKSGPHNAWGDFMDEYAVFASNFETYHGIPQTITYSIDIPVDGTYIIEYAADNNMQLDWDGTNIINHSGFTSSTTSTFNFTAGTHDLKMQVTNQANSDNADNWDKNPAGGAWRITKQTPSINVVFNSDGGVDVLGVGKAAVTFDFEWDDNPNDDGKALNYWTIPGVKFSQGNATTGSASKTVVLEAGSYRPTIRGNTGGFVLQNNNSEIHFRDQDGTDTNAQISITSIEQIIRSSTDLDKAGENNLIWHTRQDVLYDYIEIGS